MEASSSNAMSSNNKWMAFEPNKGTSNTTWKSEIVNDEAGMAVRAAEWGLSVVPVDGGDASSSVVVRMSGDGDRSKNSYDRATEVMRMSEESNSSTYEHLPRVSQELKDALASLQQTFVVSDATKPECPIMFASSGFFTMTGYSSKEVVGRNW